MEEIIKKKFTKDVIESAVKKYGATYDDLILVGNHQSYVYKVKKANDNIFIRITHVSHRDEQLILAEIEWIKHLSANSIRVAMPIKSKDNNVVELIHSEGQIFIVVAFEEAKGKGIGQQPWSFETPKTLGFLTGQMHSISKDYRPINNNRRYTWVKNNFISKASDYLPKEQFKVIAELNDLVNKINKLPKDRDSYGLIHGDLVACNYHINGNEITFFDFDESCYCWYINDIAIQLFYWSLTWQGYIDKEGSYLCAKNFLEGYSRVCKLETFWLEQIPLFIRLREIILYISIYRSKNLNELDEWNMNFMDGRRERIENNIPFIDIDFSKL